MCQATGEAATVWQHVDASDEGDYLTPAKARERAAELRQMAARPDAPADVAGSAVTA